MLQKAPRRTRELILELSLRLFNEFGEPNITTTVIAEEMNISPGNLYYHFRNKDDIVNSIFVQFEADIERILTVPEGRRSNIEDVWLYLHLMFELVWKAIWMIFYGLPQWSSGQRPPTFAEDFFNIGTGAILLLVIPWDYAWRHYVKRPGARWR